MNARQLNAIRSLTNRLQRNHHDGDLAFSMESVCGDTLMVSCNNSIGLRWFETYVCVMAFIGPRGGINVRNAVGVSVR